MGWQRGEGSGTGEEPVDGPGSPDGPCGAGCSPSAGAQGDPAAVRDQRLAGFVRGGEWDRFLPGPELARVPAAAGGPEWRCPGAEPDELIGVLRRLAALESWASAAKLGVIRELIRQDDLPALSRPRHGDLPDVWSDSLNHQLALALASSVPSAENTALTAWELGARLPGIAALLADGTLTFAKARLIAETLQFLSDADAARAEALIVPQLVGATGKTFGQIVNLAARAATEVDPGMAERRRKAAVKHASRVQMYREQSGAAALCGRDLPPDEALAANANVTARAAEYKDSGAFPGARMDQFRSTAYLDLINGRTADARIALGYLSTEPPDPETTAPETTPATATAAANQDDDGEPDGGSSGTEPPGGNGPSCGGPGNSGRGGPSEQGDGSESGDTGDSGRDNSGCGERDNSGIGDSGSAAGRGDPDRGKGRVGRGAASADPESATDGHPESATDGHLDSAVGGTEGGNSPAGRSARSQVPSASPGRSADADSLPSREPAQPDGRPVLTELTFPLATLLGLAERPGEGYRLGVLDPGLCRDLARLAAASPHSTLCITVTDRQGIAIGHGCGRRGKPAADPLDRAPPQHRRIPWRCPPG